MTSTSLGKPYPSFLGCHIYFLSCLLCYLALNSLGGIAIMVNLGKLTLISPGE